MTRIIRDAEGAEPDPGRLWWPLIHVTCIILMILYLPCRFLAGRSRKPGGR